MTYLDSRRERIAQDMGHIFEEVGRLIEAQQREDWKTFRDRCGDLVNWSKRASKEARYLEEAKPQ